jgi:hypothetical protein
LKSETLAADVRRIKFDLIFVLMTFDEQNWGSSRKLVTLLAVVNVFFSHTVCQDAIEKMLVHGAVSFDTSCYPEERR